MKIISYLCGDFHGLSDTEKVVWETVSRGIFGRMEKQNNMVINEGMGCWHALHTAPKSERKLMRSLNAAGYRTFCPMQVEFVTWNGRTMETVVPLFSGCLFVEGDARELSSFLASRKAALLVDDAGNSLAIRADRAELVSRFAALLTK